MLKNSDLQKISKKNIKEKPKKNMNPGKPFDFQTTKKHISNEDKSRKTQPAPKNISKKGNRIMTSQPNPDVSRHQKPSNLPENRFKSHLLDNPFDDWQNSSFKDPYLSSTQYLPSDNPRFAKDFLGGMNLNTDPGSYRRRPWRGFRQAPMAEPDWSEPFCLSSRLFDIYRESKMMYRRKNRQIAMVQLEMKRLLRSMHNSIRMMSQFCTNSQDTQLLNMKIREFRQLQKDLASSAESEFQLPGRTQPRAMPREPEQSPRGDPGHKKLIRSETIRTRDGKTIEVNLHLLANQRKPRDDHNLEKRVSYLTETREQGVGHKWTRPEQSLRIADEVEVSEDSVFEPPRKQIKRR